MKLQQIPAMATTSEEIQDKWVKMPTNMNKTDKAP